MYAVKHTILVLSFGFALMLYLFAPFVVLMWYR